MISVEHLTAVYGGAAGGQTVLFDVSLQVPTGRVCAIIGPSGCGKSTLLRILAGIFSSYSGVVQIDGAPVNPKRQIIGFIPQEGGLLPWRTVRENLLLGYQVKRGRADFDRAAFSDLIEQLRLTDFLNRYPGDISGGQRQRVSLGRAFFLRPDILLMDEPFSALDAISREEMQAVFLALWRSYATTTVLVTHSVEEALWLGQRIAVLTASPGHIRAVLDNPLFASPGLRERPDYSPMEVQLRALLSPGREPS